ncbi:phosphoenolpyruvate synthase [Mucilaginibacter gossypii]|uniref:phosphoenolpyruvate synthase n=1 Tax=Mucilaginibacter gossypii TaxID=551996 RepID=UPI000DCDAAAB|nr:MULTISPECIES: phosphoenolpyruvate synthase [Mucilaginibacter]QTE38899.1 phosphoenolpyruvate synthase [Mucilaginibacter gossypii]RAV55028.1 phosphoenolpyruvate synthase [Mucilaginibacter rubeus]
MEHFIRKFSEITIGDIGDVGGKTASLGEIYNQLTNNGINTPNGFAVTVAAFRYFIGFNRLEKKLIDLMTGLDRQNFSNLTMSGARARKLIMDAVMPNDLQMAIIDAYDYIFENAEPTVAVRSSATAEDLPGASFAGQHESFLNIKGHSALLTAVKQCFASLYTDRAIKYREDKNFDHGKVYLSVAVQKMVRSDMGCSGIGFTLEPESGFKDIIHISGVWGLGENIVQGTVTPDEFLVFKPTLKKNLRSIIQKNLGSKNKTMVCATTDDATNPTINQDTPWELRQKFVLSDQEVEKLANWALIIEDHYRQPMDFEWAKDGFDHQLYIIQARPETVHNQEKKIQVKSFKIAEKGEVITMGAAIGNGITAGRARVLKTPDQANLLKEGEILVTETTSPDWDPVLKKVAGIVTNNGGRTSHAAIIARELGAVAVVGTTNGTYNIEDGEMITICCAEGKTGMVYRGKLEWTETVSDVSKTHLPVHPKAQLIIADPGQAFKLSMFPNHGVGLMRIEFIIANQIGIHPMALVHFNQVLDEQERVKIAHLTAGYADKKAYFVDKLVQGVATIAAAFYPKDVIVRMSDFKTNEYAGLIGGRYFEPKEENPMIGFRGASRYYDDHYRDGFLLECEAMKVVRDEMGFNNIKLMIPFCRTVKEGQKVIDLMSSCGLKRGLNDLEIFVMAEIPSNVLLAEEFAEVFDGFSIGSNDLTQLTLGIDRDSALIAGLFDEQDAASKQLIVMMIQKANKLKKKVGLCGQAASDSETFTRLLVETGIDSIAFNADALIKGIENINAALKSSKNKSQPSAV